MNNMQMKIDLVLGLDLGVNGPTTLNWSSIIGCGRELARIVGPPSH